MPRYCYHCEDCGEAYEVVHSMGQSPDTCTLCGTSGKLKKIPTLFSVDSTSSGTGTTAKQRVDEFITTAKDELKQHRDELSKKEHEGQVDMDPMLYILIALSVSTNVVLVWYIKRLMSNLEDATMELVENIDVFQGNLEQILNTDLVAGEPIVKQLLDDVKLLGAQTENIKNRLLPQGEDKE